MNVHEEIKGVRTWYNLIAEEFDKRYEGVEGFYWENFESKIVNELIDVKDKVVLDLGCGGGRYALSVYKKVKKIIGIDISDKLIDIAKKKLTPDMPIEFLVGDAANTCFKDGYFDAVVSLGMFEFLEDPSPFLREINRILKPDGDFLFTCYNEKIEFIGNTKIFQLILKPMWKPIENRIFGDHKSTATLNSYNPSSEIREKLYKKVAHTPRQINELLLKNGLRLINYRTFGFNISDKIFHTMERLRYKTLQNNIFIFSTFFNRLCGRLPLIKNKGGVLIIKARKS
ncbi:Ubiquinone biosynthesis O-methyltransferase [subsurface metagenome]